MIHLQLIYLMIIDNLIKSMGSASFDDIRSAIRLTLRGIGKQVLGGILIYE